LVTPAIAVLLGLWWLHEQITWYIVAGGICIMAGILLTIRSRKPITLKEQGVSVI